MSDARLKLRRDSFAFRLVVALLQALALYLLTSAAASPAAWPATSPAWFVPLLLIATFTPIVLLFGCGRLDYRTLAVWGVAVAVVVGTLGLHEATRGRVVLEQDRHPVYWPWFDLWVALSSLLFAAHALVVDSITERKLLPSYQTHFTTAWKQGVQLALSLIFTGVFWLVLRLGAELFDLLDMHFFEHLIDHRWFSWPATTLAFAVAIQITDVESDLLRGARTLALTLFTWLLPVLVVIVAGFLCVLPFVSVRVLWATHFATSLLLTAVAVLIVLINAAYQDGAAERTRLAVLRLAGSVGALEILPLTGLAVWALSLRVGQYGWTVERVLAASVALNAGIYAIGYAVAVIRRGAWLHAIEATNAVGAYVALVVILALFTPVADPARLMVASQVARLQSGAVAPDAFDFVSLKFDGARWGRDALLALSNGSGNDTARRSAGFAKAALAAKFQYGEDLPNGKPKASGAEILGRFVVLPAGHAVPAAFADPAFWRGFGYGTACTTSVKPETQPAKEQRPPRCVIRFLTLRPGEPEAAIVEITWSAYVIEPDAGGKWREVATIRRTGCHSDEPLELHGDIATVAHDWPDLMLGNERVSITPDRC